jgi:hypothetical protein
MHCSKCGEENAEGAKFCSKCGAELSASAKPSKAAAMPRAENSTRTGDAKRTKGFMASLFDPSFRDFVTPRVISILYIILLVVAGIGAIAIIVFMFGLHPAFGVLTLLILGPLYFLVCALGSRVMLEVVLVIFHIRQELSDMHSTLKRD